MRIETLFAAAILALDGASAHPTISHAHLHKQQLADVLAKRNDYSGVDWKEAVKSVDWDQVFNNKPKATGAAVAPGSSAPQSGSTATTTPPPSSGSGSSGSGSGTQVKSGSGSSGSSSGSSGGSGSCLDLTKLGKRATAQQDGYTGNSVGNIHPESNCKSSGSYSLTFVNKRGSKKTYWLWNKAGTGGTGFPNGMMIPATEIFDLEDGQSATWTFDKNSLVGFSEDCGRATQFGNVPNCNVGEASFADGNTAGGSDGGSFYDVSMVPYTDISTKGGSPSKVPMTISAPGCDDSSMTQCNYIEATQNSPGNFPSGSSGCKIGNRDASPLHVTVTFG